MPVKGRDSNPILIRVKTPSNLLITLSCTPEDTVFAVKEKITTVEPRRTPALLQVLFHPGTKKILEDSESNLGAYSGATLKLGLLPVTSLIPLDSRLRDPVWDWDYYDLTDDGVRYYRGDFRYRRPLGWTRIGLKVSDVYGADRTWLGPEKRGSQCKTYPGEWPVAYHGTMIENVASIASQGFLLSQCVNFAQGVGIYTTPDINVAEGFAVPWTTPGASYKVVIQCRVNPKSVDRVLVEDPLEYWISKEESDVRPYAVLVKRVDLKRKDLEPRVRRRDVKDDRKVKKVKGRGQGCICM